MNELRLGLGRTLLVTTLLSSMSLACGPSHIAPFTPRQRKYEPGAYAATSKGARRSCSGGAARTS